LNPRSECVNARPDPGLHVAPYDNPAEFNGSFTGGFVWHCHILEHEENDMMNFYEVV
jgi:FtsP/CotA-like multicopper oxidase with cupredoxin domain